MIYRAPRVPAQNRGGQTLSTRADAAAAADKRNAPTDTGGADRTAATNSELLSLILKSLDDDKAEDVVTIDLTGRSEMADSMVIASGRSSRQVAAISEKLADRLKSRTGQPVRMEGKETADWVLIDAGDAIVHVFRPEVREFYQLEKMWLPPEAQLRRTAAPADA